LESGALDSPGANESHGGYPLNVLHTLDIAVPAIIKLTVTSFPAGKDLGILDDAYTEDQYFDRPVAPGVYFIALQSVKTWYIYAYSGAGYDPNLVADVTYEVLVAGAGISGDCVECDDGNGGQLPPFTPGFMPTFRPQIGDPTTWLDNSICQFESAAMVLNWHTRGAVDVWGGELIPWCGKSEAAINGQGANLTNMKQAWQHWNQHLELRGGQYFSDLIVALSEGRAVILDGIYAVLPNDETCSGFSGSHGISVYPYQVGDRLLVGDPLCHDFKGIKRSSLQAYAEAFGEDIYGIHSPQPIYFAVSGPWVP